ncbi:MAG: leucyl aminopeptidase [Acidimicrobiia bacterium]|nr:leucyl aminopeptidase [Acidimicrobiia bacterium]
MESQLDIEFVESQEDAASRAGVLGLAARPGLVWQGDAEGYVASLGAGFERALERAGFKGEAGQSCSYDTGSENPHTVVALGTGEDPGADDLRRAAGVLGRKASKDASVATTLAFEGQAASVVEGFLLSQYSYDRFKSKPEPAVTDSLLLVGAGEMSDCEAGMVVAEAVGWARDLVNTPAQDKAPQEIQRQVAEMAEGLGLRLKTHDVPDLEEKGFGGLLGVAAGSDRAPCLVELWHEPEGSETFVALVGKGITFDSGGLSIKPASAMETMKTDMSGAAAVIGAMVAIARLRLPVKVLGLAPLSDNMPGSRAIKPGDVLTTRNGKTIEVLNTDAEGRLVLADALAYAVEHEPDLMVDLATLTGACKVALGDDIAGVMGNDDSLIDRIERAGDQAGERVWHLPLPKEYRRQLDTPMADMKNIGGRWAGALTAGLLLQEFVDDVPWAHLDIAGPSRWTRNEHYQTKGGSGFGVRTLVELVANLAEQGFGTTE